MLSPPASRRPEPSADHGSVLSSLAEITSKLSRLNLAELPKKGTGVKVKNDENFSVRHSSSNSVRHKFQYSKKSNAKNSKIVKPNVPFSINGKPHSPWIVKNKLKKDKNNKKKNDRNSIKTNEIFTEMNYSTKKKPSNVNKVNNPNEIVPDASEQKSKKPTKSRLGDSGKNQQTSESGQKSGISTSSSHKNSKVKLKPQNSPIFTYKLPPNLSFNSLRSILGSIKDTHSLLGTKTEETKETTTRKPT